ncbi:MAG: hypothetical protein Q7S20_01790 [Gemmatimonadaceae bacterium]|nr:hypothetical protein [Gemmatimonadaceae bacterium]
MVSVRSCSSARCGASRLGCLIQVIVLGALLYFGSIVGEEALIYYRFHDAMKNEARFAARRSDQQIKDRLRAFTDSVDLPASAKDVNIVREGNTIRIWSEYDQEFNLPFNKHRIVHLRPSVEKSF